MTPPRPRYALPWPPDADPPDPEVGASTDAVQHSALWMGSCPRCAGRGVVDLGFDLGVAAQVTATCPVCLGSGVETASTMPRRGIGGE